MAWAPGAPGSVGANVVFTSAGYLPFMVPTATLRLPGSPSNLTITLRTAPIVDVTVVDAEGKPLPNAGLGWFVEKAGTIRARYEACCSSDQGKISFGPDGVPEGEVTLFSTTRGEVPRFGTSSITAHAGKRYSVTVRVARPLLKVRGRVVDADGSPLAALVSVEPVRPSAFSALDRVLLDVRGADTDLEGRFELRITSPGDVRLRLSTWTGLGTGATHVQTKTLTEITAQLGLDPEPVVLKAPAVAVVRCTMLGPNNARLALSELGLFFAPHRQGGHSGSCVWAGGALRADDDAKRSFPRQVNFIWPSGAETLLVTARAAAEATTSGESRQLIGEVALKHATDPCQIHGM